MQSPWRIELLGWLRAENDGSLVTRFATRKTAALLARLALWPQRTHSREELAELLWPDTDFELSRTRLRQALTSLRHQLEPPGVTPGSVIIADRTHIRLNPEAITTDVAEFEAAIRTGKQERASMLYRGELLPGFYEDWILLERERLQACFEEISNAAPRAILSGETSISPELSQEASLPVRLPLQFTRFFGREEECEKIAALFSDHSLVTLTGPGGSGKTRLALEAARRETGHRQVLFVSLADLTDGARLTEALAEGLRLPPEDDSPAMDRVVEALSLHPTLLVLDNLEHLVPYAAALILTLLTRILTLRLLVTSRRRLHVAGERELPVPPLPIPPGGASLEELGALASVRLFVDRAQAIRPDFQLTARNADAIGMLCQRLEGLPLALELAAARASTLSPSQILERLSHRFELLATRRADKDGRHRSLWAAISWSVELLPTGLQHFWRALCVFPGSFTQEAAAAVTGEKSALESLTQLRERSLLSLEEGEDQRLRFRLAESLREFAREQIDEEDWSQAEQRHAAFFLGLARESEEALRGSEQVVWLGRLAEEQENLRQSFTEGERRGDSEYCLSLAGALWGFWERRGQMREGQQWLERALALTTPASLEARSKALNRLGAILNATCDFDRAMEVHQEARELYLQQGDIKGIAQAWNRIGFVAGQRGRDEEAREAFHEALALERQLGNRFNMAAALNGLGILAQNRSDLDDATLLFTEALELFQALDNSGGIADTLFNLASIEIERQRWEDALALLDRAGTIYESMGDAWSRSYVSFSQGVVARYQERWADAARLLTEALTVCREVGDQKKIADILFQQGALAQSLNEPAAQLYQEALAIYESLGNASAAADCRRTLASLV
ncbi:MAG: tetratricopeptide repeat protein [Armatimonas sp.]